MAGQPLFAQNIGGGYGQRQVVEGSRKSIQDGVPVAGPDRPILKYISIGIQGYSLGPEENLPCGHGVGVG